MFLIGVRRPVGDGLEVVERHRKLGDNLVRSHPSGEDGGRSVLKVQIRQGPRFTLTFRS